MTQVIDSLVVEVGLDPRKFSEGERDLLSSFKKTGESAQAFGKNVEAQGMKITDIFSMAKQAVVGIVAVTAGSAFAKVIDNISRMDATTGRMSTSIGIGVQNLGTWQNILRQVGGTAESATGTLSTLQDTINNISRGIMPSAEFVTLLNQMHVSLQGSNSDKLLHDLARGVDLLKQQGISATTIATALRSVPGMTQDMINVLLEGVAGLNRYEAAAKRALPTPESIQQGKEYVTQVALLDQAWQGLERTLTLKVGPALLGIIKMFQGWLSTPGSAEAKKIEGEVTKKLGNAHDFLLWFGDMIGLDHDKNKAELDKFYGAGTPSSSSHGTPAAGATIPVKPGAGTASPAMRRVTDAIGSISELKQVTAYNDVYHQFLGKGDAHSQGRALDVTIKDPSKSGEVAKKIRAALAAAGIDAKVIDEYANPSANATGGHIHVGISQSAALRGAQIGAGGAAVTNNNQTTSGNTNTHTSSTNIGQINIKTAAADAQGIAADIRPAIQRASLTAPANYGLV